MGFTLDEKKAWDYLYGKIQNKYGVAGLIGNLCAESSVISYRMQGDYQPGYAKSKDYTARVDSGAISRETFANDGIGYGLAQWTYITRAKALYDFAKSKDVSIGDLDMQLEFLMKELTTQYKSVLNTLKNATSVLQASNAVLFDFENPLVQNEKVQKERADLGEKYYTQFANNVETEGTTNMGYANYTKKKSVKVSAHFYSTEFDCHGSGCCSKTIINERLIEFLEEIRVHFNAPVTVTSAYRCPTHNRNIGGATGSRHSKGDAADIVVKGVAPRAVAQYAESIGILGIGLYETQADGYFVHIDTRDYKSFWYGQAQRAMSTFGGSYGGSSNASASSNANTGFQIIDRYDRGDAIKDVQNKLIKLGYPCKLSGYYDDDTFEAVCSFQDAYNIGVDGIVGYQTMTALNKAAEEAGSSTARVVKVTASVLNIRKGPGTNYAITGAIRDKGIYRVVSEATGTGASKWGKLSDGRGWISLDYCTIP